jgi:hypothetical protein
MPITDGIFPCNMDVHWKRACVLATKACRYIPRLAKTHLSTHYPRIFEILPLPSMLLACKQQILSCFMYAVSGYDRSRNIDLLTVTGPIAQIRIAPALLNSDCWPIHGPDR